MLAHICAAQITNRTTLFFSRDFIMRLAIFTNVFPSHVNTFFARDIRALLEAKIDIDIFSFYPLDPKLWQYVPEILSEEIFPRKNVHHISLVKCLKLPKPCSFRKISKYLLDTTAITISSAKYGIIPVIKSAYTAVKAWAWAQKYANNYDHILAYWGNYSANCAYIFQRLSDTNVPLSIFFHAGIDLYFYQLFLKKKLLYADNIIVVCDFNKRFIQKLYPEIYSNIENKIYLHHLGLDLDNFPFNEKEKSQNKIIAVGRLVKQKGFDYLLRALHEIKKRDIKFELVLVGKGEEEKSLYSLAKELGILDHVDFCGWRTIDEVKTAMSSSTVLVHPSPDIGDAVPTVIKEAMALGTPVIATTVAGIPELLNNGKSGILVPPSDVLLLADAIEKLLRDRKMLRKYSIKGRKFAEETFDLWRNGKRLADIIYSTKRS